MIFLGVAEAAMGRDRLPGRIVAGARRQEFGAVRLGATRLAAVVEPRRLFDHQPRRFQIHPFLGEQVLDALVLADRPVEDDAIPGILGRAAQPITADTDHLGADAHAFGAEAGEDIGEDLAFIADTFLASNTTTPQPNNAYNTTQ